MLSMINVKKQTKAKQKKWQKMDKSNFLLKKIIFGPLRWPHLQLSLLKGLTNGIYAVLHNIYFCKSIN